MNASHHQQKAFSRTEVLISVASVFILFALALTSLADNKGRSQKLLCMDNLRQIGEGFDAWRFDHQDFHPWHVPSTNGGTYGLSAGLPWVEFTFLSNRVSSPRILACPSDLKSLSRTAAHWGTGPGGLQNSGYRNNSVSYTIGLHSFIDAPQTILSSDRHLSVQGINSFCTPARKSAGVSAIYWASETRWTNDVHGNVGNLLFNDGSVEEKTSNELGSVLAIIFRGAFQNLHLLIP